MLKSGRAPLTLVSPSPLKMRHPAGAIIGGLPPPPPPPVRTAPSPPPRAAATAAQEVLQHSVRNMRVSDGQESSASGGEGSGNGGRASSATRATHVADGLANVAQLQLRSCADGSPGIVRSAASLTGIERPALSRLVGASACDRAGETVLEESPSDSRSSSVGGEDLEARDSVGESQGASGTQGPSAGLAKQLQGLSHGGAEDSADPKQPSDWGDFVG